MAIVHGVSKVWAVSLAGMIALVTAAALAGTGTAPLGFAAETPTTQPVDREITVDIEAVTCPPGYDNEAEDEVCLAYDGQIPGPSFVFEQNQRVELTLRHRVNQTITALDPAPGVAKELRNARYTLHRHGVNLDACEDGVARPRGTEICDSTVGPEGANGPNGSITYTFETSFPGFWHYHDHALELDAGSETPNLAGPMAEHRGLFGSFLVLEPGEETDHVFDLHLLDTGPNGGLGLNGTVEAGERFDLIATGLGDLPWTVSLQGPEGTQLGSYEIGPGVARGFTIEDAQPGTYTWTAQTLFLDAFTFTGEVTVE